MIDMCYNKGSTILIPPPRPSGIAPARGALLYNEPLYRFDKHLEEGILSSDTDTLSLKGDSYENRCSIPPGRSGLAFWPL